jgi:glycosyltransferase involved in cell wall biosynthesis
VRNQQPERWVQEHTPITKVWSMSESESGVCIVTQPQRSQSKDHTHDLADIIAAITPVAVLTANLPAGSSLRANYEVVEFSLAGTGERASIEAVRFLLNQLRLCAELHKRDEGTVLFFGTTSYFLPVILCKIVRKKAIILPRGDVPLSLRLRWEDQLPNSLAQLLAGAISLLERVNYRLADAIVTYTPAMAVELELEQYEEKLYTNGARFVDVDQFNVQIPYEQRERVIGFLGRLDVEKRVPELTAAIKQLPDDIQVVFIGDGDYRGLLEQQLSTEIGRGQVEVTGWVDRKQVPKYLNQLRLLVLPSQATEGLPTALLEAMACGTPVYATPIAGVPDIVCEGQTGILMEEVGAEAIAADIEDFLSGDDCSVMSETARALIETEYSFEEAVSRWEDILNSSNCLATEERENNN